MTTMEKQNIIETVANSMLSTARRSKNIIHPGRMSLESMIAMTSAYFDDRQPDCGSIFRHAGPRFASALLYRKIKDVFKVHYYIQFYHTEEAFRRRGFTSSMVEELLEKAKQEGVHEVSARVQDWNVASHGLLTQRLGFKPSENIYYRLLAEKINGSISSPEPATYKYADGDELKYGKPLAVYYVSNAAATGGVELSNRAMIQSLKNYLQRDGTKFVVEDATANFAICEPVYHPYKDFFSVKLHGINPHGPTAMFLMEIENLAERIKLPEVSIRTAFTGNESFGAMLLRTGFTISDTSYTFHL